MINGDLILCGLFDSSKTFKNTTVTEERVVGNYEIELFESGDGISFVGENQYRSKRGMLLSAKPEQRRHSKLPARCRFLKIVPHKDLPDGLVALLDSLPECVYIESEYQTSHLLNCFEELSLFLRKKSSSENVLKLNALFYELLYRCKQICSSIEISRDISPSSKIALEARSYLDSHFCEDCSLNILSEVVYASPNHIRTVFQKHFGISPYEYILQKRIEQARIWISEQKMSFTEIALRLNFCSQSHFNKLFKERVGCTPKEYREKNLSVYLN